VVLSQMTRLESGVYIQTLEGGAGLPVAENSEAVLDYTLWLADGTQIESREGVPFVIGPGRVIDGFYLGMQGAREGETRLIVIPSHLGYGPGGQNAIPGSAVLVFRVHVVSVEPPS
jgi:FKBP-type peptidyl-prolyl cis-trans isomerase FkpA